MQKENGKIMNQQQLVTAFTLPCRINTSAYYYFIKRDYIAEQTQLECNGLV